MRDPYRVIVWGPGNVGKAALKILYGRPDFEIVGVLCHSFGKRGVDVGQYIGREHLGLRMSQDRDEVFGTDADVVIYTGLPPFDRDAFDADICSLLESGKNVIAITAYNNPYFHGPEYVGTFEEACRKGNSSLHGTGELPGFFLDRVALTLTGLCKEVRHIRLEEWYNTANYPVSTMGFFGVNSTPEDFQGVVAQVSPVMMNSYAEALTLVCESVFDARPEVTFDADYALAEERLDLPLGTVAQGKVADLKFTFTASIDGEPRLDTVLNWSFTKDERWLIEIEGDPVSLRSDIHGFASLEGELMNRPGDTTRVGAYCTAMPCVQAIPKVVAAEPGVVYPEVFTNAMPDMRKLAERTSIAG